MWTTALPFIEKALARSPGDYTPEDVFGQIRIRFAQLWPGKKSAAVTRLHDYDGKKVLRIWLAAGDMSELVNQMLPASEEWALSQGLDAIEVEGRKGWTRVLAPLGFKEVDGVLTKELYGHGI